MTDEAIALLAPRIGTRAACAAAGVPQATWYRRHRTSPAPARPAPVPHRDRVQPRALARAERQAILDALHSERFTDTAPAEVWATLLDEGTYLGSVLTYLPGAARSRGEPRAACAGCAPGHGQARTGGSGLNQVYSWDITKLHGPAKWTYYHLYVILDIFSRYVAGWMVATRESAVLAEKLIAATCAKQGISRGQLTIHADRGSSMTSKPVALLLADLGVTQSHSRPHVSNDNPYSEAQFKTLKYRPGFPRRFASIEAARAHCQDFFCWYNNAAPPRRPRPAHRRRRALRPGRSRAGRPGPGAGHRLPRPSRAVRPQARLSRQISRPAHGSIHPRITRRRRPPLSKSPAIVPHQG